MTYRVFITRGGVKVEKFYESEKKAIARTVKGWGRDKVSHTGKWTAVATMTEEKLKPNWKVVANDGPTIEVHSESIANKLAEELATIYGKAAVFRL